MKLYKDPVEKIKKKMYEKTGYTKALSQLKKADSANTPRSIKRKLNQGKKK